MDRLPANVDVVRSLRTAPEFRQVSGEIGTLYGYFSAFDSWYEVASMWEGDFLERVAPGAFAQTIAEDRDGMRVLFDHGFDPQLGNKVLGPIESLAEDSRGAAYEVPLFDTSYNRDLLPGLRAGVYGASMRMRVMADSWDDEPGPSAHNPKGLPERSITRAQVMEFGPVTFPASLAASAGVRSTTDRFYEQLKRRDELAYADACRAAGPLAPVLLGNPDGAGGPRPTDLTGRPGARRTGGGGSKDDGPGSGASARSASLARHHELILLGVLK